MISALTRNTIPLIVATALFMANLDATVLATSLPEIAKDLGLNPIHLKLALTSYLLALAVFIPASGWIADRYGPKTVFRAAMAVFALGSVACGFAQGLGSLVAARVLQGIGGAMMMPVGRLIVLRTVPREEMIGAMAWLTIPALLGPVMGPLLGGFISTYFDWRWIFWINIPVAAMGMYLVTRFIPDVRDGNPDSFDMKGFLLVGPGLSMFLTGATLLGLDFVSGETVAALLAIGAILLALYIPHALKASAPLIDIRLLAVPTFLAGVFGGFLFRIGIGAAPFLLPLLLQNGFRHDAVSIGAFDLCNRLRRHVHEDASGQHSAPLRLSQCADLQRAACGGVFGVARAVHGCDAGARHDGDILRGRPVALAAVHQHQHDLLRRHSARAIEPRHELRFRRPGVVRCRRRLRCGAGLGTHAAHARRRRARAQPFPAGVPVHLCHRRAIGDSLRDPAQGRGVFAPGHTRRAAQGSHQRHGRRRGRAFIG